jgi:hypothetical protein
VKLQHQHPTLTNAHLDAMHEHRPVIASAHIVLARPHHLDRRSSQAFGDRRRGDIDGILMVAVQALEKRTVASISRRG